MYIEHLLENEPKNVWQQYFLNIEMIFLALPASKLEDYLLV